MINRTGAIGATPDSFSLGDSIRHSVHRATSDRRTTSEQTSKDPMRQSQIKSVILRLAAARQMAVDCGRPLWDFAVELPRLLELGINHDELRWLIGKGYCDHAYEKDQQNNSKRSFESLGGFSITDRSCFVLTDRGLSVSCVIVALCDEVGEVHTIDDEPRPTWDDQRHELRVGSVVIKQFKWRASNQETILTAFEEEEWPPRIDDPLPQDPEIDPKRRLNDAIKSLNRRQKTPILRFHGDGSGQGIYWELIAIPD